MTKIISWQRPQSDVVGRVSELVLRKRTKILKHFPAGQTVYFCKELVSDSQWPLDVGMEVEVLADPARDEVTIRRVNGGGRRSEH